jgi:general secretion pathway protein K
LRIDLNTAERQLIVGALRAAGAAPGTADDLATKIIGRRAGQPAGSAPQQAGNDTMLFQTVSELAAFPGITPDMAIAIEAYVTVSSGLAGVRLEALDDGLLSDIPGLPPSARKAIKDFHAGRLSREQLEQSLAAVAFNTLQQAPSWRVEIRTTLRSGYSESFKALMLVSNADEAPYRVLDWRRAAIELE